MSEFHEGLEKGIELFKKESAEKDAEISRLRDELAVLAFDMETYKTRAVNSEKSLAAARAALERGRERFHREFCPKMGQPGFPNHDLGCHEFTAALSSPLPAEEAKKCEECECGHHENDHAPSPVTGRGEYCGGGLSPSCSCRKFRPAEGAKEDAK